MPDHYDKKSSGPGDEKKKKSEYTTQNGRLVKKEYIRKSPSDLGANDASSGFGKESTSVDRIDSKKLAEAAGKAAPIIPKSYGVARKLLKEGSEEFSGEYKPKIPKSYGVARKIVKQAQKGAKESSEEYKPVRYGMKKEIKPIMRYNKEIKPLPGNPNYGKTTPKKK